ncbi:MAG: lipid A deacylase LpxR family protein [Chitinophagaceae bacterium]|nr:lipid A deacylase LpxR family protein [Chitinophagaceae bacterium]
MRQFLHFPVILLLAAGCGTGEALLAQSTSEKAPVTGEEAPTFLFRVYEDNDFINIRGQGTDDAYTNGTRLDLFYTKKHPGRHGLYKLLPKAGEGSRDTYGWGLMQLMFTPNDITQTAYQPDDYPYSGALIVTHTLYSFNPVKKFDWQTELVAGVIGPASLAAQTQRLVHRLINYIQPMGWDHQFRNDVLVNINMTAEKQLAAWGHALEVIGGGQVFYGTMLNGLALYPLIRIGKMTPYFEGYMSQYSSKKWQFYFVFKPEAQIIFRNAMLQGGMFTHNPNLGTNQGPAGQGHAAAAATAPPLPYRGLEHWVYSLNYGAVVSTGKFSISFIQNTSSAMMKGLYSHEVGNISLFFAW